MMGNLEAACPDHLQKRHCMAPSLHLLMLCIINLDCWSCLRCYSTPVTAKATTKQLNGHFPSDDDFASKGASAGDWLDARLESRLLQIMPLSLRSVVASEPPKYSPRVSGRRQHLVDIVQVEACVVVVAAEEL